VILTNEELAGLERRTYKGARHYCGDDEIVVSEENALTIKSFKRNFSKINETVDYCGTMAFSTFILPSLNSNWKICCHAIKELLQKYNSSFNPNNSAKSRPLREG
jgi:hypothetical protein